MIDEEKEIEAKEIADDDNDSFFTVSTVPTLQMDVVRATTEEDKDDKHKEDEAAKDDDDEENKTDVTEDDELKENLRLKKEHDWKEARKIYGKAHELEAENEGLKKALALSLEYGQHHYKNGIDSRLEKIMQNRMEALQTGDSEAFAKTDLELFEAIQTKREIENRRPITYSDPEPEQHTQADTTQVMLQQWFQHNPELNHQSPFFDKGLAEEVLPLVRELDSQLKNSDQADWICTPEYYNYLQSQVNGIKGGGRKIAAKATYSTKHIGGVRSTSQGGGSSTSKDAIALTPDQKEIAALFKISDEAYLKRYNKAERERTGN